jgi:RHS repeat-associated protein
VKIGYDNNGDGDIADAGDTIEVSDGFASSGMSLTYDNNGNLTSDGVLQYVYDGWNRLKKAQRKAAHSGQADDVTTLATYAYLPDNRRASKVVEHCGIEAVANDGGDTTVHFYYGGVPHASGGVTRWNVFETRNGSNQATRQWVWGSRYVDEVVFMDVNGSVSYNNTCDPDVADGSSTKDRRFFYHQDRNWNVVALSEYADGVGTNARVVERYAYTPYGEFVVLKGDAGNGELGNLRPTSTVGNPFFHQGLPLDHEKGSYQNRWREYAVSSARFAQVDPLLRAGRLGAQGNRPTASATALTFSPPEQYSCLAGNPLRFTDATGLACSPPDGCTIVGGGPFDFTACCNQHDECYCVCSLSKNDCDIAFRDCMYHSCEISYPNDPVTRNLCYALADTYYVGVQLLGLPFWCHAHSSAGCQTPWYCCGL